MRNDLGSMGCGRAAAQASHASNAFIHKFGHRKDVKSWQKQTTQGFGTAIILGCDNLVMTDIVGRCSVLHKNLPADFIVDPDYCITVSNEIAGLLNPNGALKFVAMKDDKSVIVSRPETTCAYIFGDKEELKPILGNLPLYS